MARKLIALLIGINKYATQELQGCVNDMLDVRDFLNAFCDNRPDILPDVETFPDEKATKKNIIQAFKKFREAQKEDICLLYFSGHGVEFDAPTNLYQPDDNSKRCQALVCYGANNGSNLLIDKEISCLIYEATKDKKPHFVFISDCCHSGTNSKEGGMQFRNFSEFVTPSDATTFYGYDSENSRMQDGQPKYWFPVGPHIKFSSCLDSELSGEDQLPNASGKIRGLFTYSLMQVLREQGVHISYKQLIIRANALLSRISRYQTANARGVALQDTELSKEFLNGLVFEQEPLYPVWYHSLHGWILEAGSMHGLDKYFKINVYGSAERYGTVNIAKVNDQFSILEQLDMMGYDRQKLLVATLTIPPIQRLNVLISPDADAQGLAFFEEAMQITSTNWLSFDKNMVPRYVLHIKNEQYYITHPKNDFPIIGRGAFSKESAVMFLEDLEQVARYHMTVEIRAPQSSITDEQVKISLAQVPHPLDDPNRNDKFRLEITDWSANVAFYYSRETTKSSISWKEPAFELSIENKGNESLWVAGLYCGSGYDVGDVNFHSTLFSITDRFLQAQELPKGNKILWSDEVGGFQHLKDGRIEDIGINETKAIQLSVLNDYFNRGYNEIKDVIKIFVSKKKFDSLQFVQKGVKLEYMDIESEKNDVDTCLYSWRTYEIPITIIRPRNEGSVYPSQALYPYDLTIGPAADFEAEVFLCTAEEMMRSIHTAAIKQTSVIRIPRPEIFWAEEQARILEIKPGISEVEGISVLEFYTKYAHEAINDKQKLPICWNLLTPSASDRSIWIAGYSAFHNRFIPLAEMSKDGRFDIEALPEPTYSCIKGTGDSIKLFFVEVSTEKTRHWANAHTTQNT